MTSLAERCDTFICLCDAEPPGASSGGGGGAAEDAAAVGAAAAAAAAAAAEKQLSKKKKKKKDLKKLSKREKVKSEHRAALNLLLAASRRPLLEALVEHQCQEVRKRLPGSDFSAVRLVRLVGLIKRVPAAELTPETRAQYDAIIATIFEAFEDYRFWPTDDGSDLMIFWSENHLILYQSTQLLLEQWRAEAGGSAAEERPSSPCKCRVLFFLRQRKRLGFFEFNSHGYIMFTLSALLNLVDFAADDEIATLARDGVSQILGNVLSFALPSGVFFSVTGRGYLKHRCSGKGYDVNNVINLLTGAGPRARQVTSAAAFLATSKYARAVPPEVLAQWRAPSRSFRIGLSVNAMVKALRDDPALGGRVGEMVPFLWSMGAYFHPNVVRHTVDLLNYTARTKSKCKNLWKVRWRPGRPSHQQNLA